MSSQFHLSLGLAIYLAAEMQFSISLNIYKSLLRHEAMSFSLFIQTTQVSSWLFGSSSDKILNQRAVMIL